MRIDNREAGIGGRKALSSRGILNMSIRLRPVHAILIIMVVSLLLRLILVANGGQRYFPDEYRYSKYAAVMADSVFNGDVSGFLRLFEYRRHPGAAAATFIPALLHRLAYELTAGNDVSWRDYWRNPTSDFRFSAIFFAIPSVLSIGLICYIARRAGADELEGLIAAFLLAASNTWFIWSRHFLTYDVSMLFALAALFIALRPHERDLRDGILTGLFLFCAFWVYTNHVFLVCAIGFLYCLVLARNPRMMIARLFHVSIGALIPLLPVLIYNYTVVNIDVFAGLLEQVERITQGSYEEGAVLPFVYFFEAEGVISLLWLTGLVLAFKEVVNRRPDKRHRIMLWFTALLMLYGLMALFSSGLHVIVLFGRTVRALIPFIVLICAYGFAPYLKLLGYKPRFLLICALAVLALMNFATAANVQYYTLLVREISDEYGTVSFSSQFVPPSWHHGFPNPVHEDARYEILNAAYFYPITEMTDLPDGEVIMKVAHPYMYKPWQYEGMTPEMREIINRDGLYIWLIDKGPAVEE